jgi:hypothetical protein
MSRRYAEHTSVSVEKSKATIETLLAQHGADDIFTGISRAQCIAFVAFVIDERQVKLMLPLPDINAIPRKRHRRGDGACLEDRTDDQISKEWEQQCRQRWRALLLVVRGKLEMIEIGASSVDREFLADFAMRDGRVLWQAIAPQLDNMNQVPQLPAGRASGGVVDTR